MADNPSSSRYLGVLCSFEADGQFAGEVADCFRGLGKTVGGLQKCVQGGYCLSVVRIQCMEQCCTAMS